ncbi:MAG: ABC transporter permease [Acidobacteriota bacterium]
MIRLAVGWYGILLWALPPQHRRRFGADMLAAFEGACRDARARQGWRGVARTTWCATTDLAGQLPGEWSEALRRRPAAVPQADPSSPRSSFLPGQRSLRLPARGRTTMLDQISRDLRHAVRALRHSPGYAAVVIATLAVGIGASTAIYSVVQAVMLAPLPYPQAERIVNIGEVSPEIDILPVWVSVPNWADYRDQLDALEHLSLFRGRSMSVTEGDDPIYVVGAFVSADFFRVFGAQPLRGRTFTAQEVVPSPPDVVVLGDELWQQRFAGDEGIVGRTVEIDGVPRTVIGIMPAGFDAPGEWISPGVHVELWLPFPLDVPSEGRINRSYNAVGRLRDGVTIAQAREQLDTVFARLREAYPEANRNWNAVLLRWRDQVVGDLSAAMSLLWAAVTLVLVVACANVASLLFARLLRRRHEIAVRKAMGASTARLLQGIVAEAGLLALLGGALGVALASGLLRAMLRFEPGRLPLTDRIHIDGGVLLVALATSIVAGLAFGLVPGWFATRRRVAAQVKDGGGRTTTGRSMLWTVMVGAQLAFAFVVAISAALVGRSFAHLTAVPAGIEADHLMTATVALSWNRVTTFEDRSRFIRDVLDRVEQIPGVESAAEINSLPFSGSNQWSAVWLDGTPADDPTRQPVAAYRNVSLGYLDTMGIPLLRGRWLTAADMQDPAVVVINQAFADNYWPDVDPLGRVIAIDNGDTTLRVAGIVGDVRHFGLDSEARPEIYLPYTRDELTSKTFVVRSEIEPAALGPRLRQAIVAVDPDQPLRDLLSMNEVIAETTAGPRFNALMMGLAAAVALALAALGLFGTMSYMVAERTRELGIRLALGGSRGRVVGHVLGQGARLAAVGLAVGLLLALAAGRLVQGLLFDIPATDPISYVVVSATFALAALAASWLPARRASRVDPVVVLGER